LRTITDRPRAQIMAKPPTTRARNTRFEKQEFIADKILGK